MEKEDVNRRHEAIKKVLTENLKGADMKLSLFVSAATNFRWDSCCIPFPPKFRTTKQDSKEIERLRQVLKNIPPLEKLVSDHEPILEPTDDVIDLLHWLLIEVKNPTLRNIPRKEFNRILTLTPHQETSVKLPTHIFSVEYGDDSRSESRFQSHAKDYDTSFAFHGTKLYNLHNITHHGLQQHLNKTALFGEGLYLSSELSVSLPYSRNGLGWTESDIGESMACVTLCEFIEHPTVATHKVSTKVNKDLPEKYIIISNNDMVRLRYLIVYANPKPKQATDSSSWKNRVLSFKFFAFIYLILLIIIGMSDSRYVNYLKGSVVRKIQSGVRVLFGE